MADTAAQGQGEGRATCVARLLWPDQATSIEPLSGGITNQNYRVTTPEGVFVVRLFAPDAHLLLIDRSIEEAATRSAAAIGVSPDVIAMLPEHEAMVTRFVDGESISLERMREPGTLARVAHTLRRVHDECAAVPAEINPHRQVERYHDTAVAHGVAIPSDYEWAHTLSSRIESVCGAHRNVLLHGDLLNANLIDDGEIRIVDWEYAGMGDPLFDLANLSINHSLDSEHDRLLLEAYMGGVLRRDLARVRVLRFMSAFRETMWSVVQHGVSKIEFDFLEYAEDYFTRMRKASDEPEFRDSLAILEEQP